MFIFVLSLFLAKVNAAEQRLPLPNEILNVLQEEYAGQTVHPELAEITLTIKSGKSSQSIKAGLGKHEIDLAAYVDKNQSSFEVLFTPSFKLGAQSKLFFINRYRPVGDKDHPRGMECGKAVKIQKQIDKLFTTQGVKFMTKDGAYLNVLGGDFLLTHLEDQKMHVVLFKFVDGRYSSRLCNKAL